MRQRERVRQTGRESAPKRGLFIPFVGQSEGLLLRRRRDRLLDIRQVVDDCVLNFGSGATGRMKRPCGTLLVNQGLVK